MNTLDRPWTLIAENLRIDPDRTAVVHSGQGHTYGELDLASAALAAGLIDRFPVGTRIGLLVGNRFEYLVADVAIMRAGLVKVPLNPLLPAADITHVLAHSGAELLLVTGNLDVVDDALLDAVATNCPAVTVVDVDGPDYSALLVDPTGEAAVSVRDIASDDAAAIYYTGGTTGRPKGVVHTQASVAANLVAHVLEAEIGRGEVMVLSTALSHSAGAFAAAGLVQGATLVVLDKFDPAALCQAAANHGATWTMVVPTMLYRLLDHLSSTATPAPAFDTIVYGSAPVAPSRLLEAMEVFGPVLIQLFGQTECPNWGTTLTKRDHNQARTEPALLGSAGRRSVMAAVRVVDEHGQPLPAGEIGEVCLAAPYTMARYHDNPEATAATLADGWVHTRDVGLLDERGYLHLKDRTSDMIITGGYNVYSSEVEAAVAALPGVSQVAVIGIPDRDWGESVCAVVVAEPGATVDTATVRDLTRAQLGAYKTPKTVHVVEEIPLTPFGKADKKLLRAPFWAGQDRAI